MASAELVKISHAVYAIVCVLKQKEETMEFVSRTQRARSVEYRRPVPTQRPSAAQSSVFGVRSTSSPVRQAPPQPKPVAHKQPAQHAAVMHAPKTQQAMEAHKVRVASHVAKTSGPQKPALAVVPVYDSAHHSSRPAVVHHETVQEKTPDLTSLFEKIELDAPVSKAYTKPHSATGKHKSEYDDVPSIKKRIFSAAVFAAAAVGMVAMGYDLFFAPKSAPVVSHISPVNGTPNPAVKTPSRNVKVASTNNEVFEPSRVTIASIGLEQKITSQKADVGTVLSVSGDDVRWIASSAKQGEYATTVLSASSSSKGQFSKLHLLKKDDTFEVVRGDDTVFVYEIDKIDEQKQELQIENLGISDLVAQPKMLLLGVQENKSILIHATQQ